MARQLMARAAGKTRYHHGDLAQALIEEGVRAVEEGGVGSLQVKGLAERLGVTHAAVYRHYKNREALLYAIARHGFVLMQAHMRRALLKSAHGTRQQLLDVGYSVIDFSLQHPRLSELMFQGHVPTSISDLATPQAEPDIGFAALTELVTLWQAEGVLREGSAHDLAVSLWVTTLGLSVLLVSGQLQMPRRRLRAFVDAVHGRMLDGLR